MKTIFFTLTLLLISCAKPHLIVMDVQPAKSEGCKFDSFSSSEEVKKPFRVICNVEGKRRRMDLMYRFSKEFVCRCGGDALITQDSGQPSPGFSSFKIIKYTDE